MNEMIRGRERDPLAEGTAQDGAVLLTFFEATNGPGWENKSGWGTDTNIRNWYGVSADAEGCVSKLSLSGNGLTGYLPASLAHVNHLQVLDLGNNELCGTIPASLAGHKRVEELNLSNNRLRGDIPADLGCCYLLRSLNLSHNFLVGHIPAELTCCYLLRSLNLSQNRLAGSIPAFLASLENLEHLNLSYNFLQGSIPAELGESRSLVKLDLSRNELDGDIPAELGRITSLVELNLSYNFLGGIPKELAEGLLLLDELIAVSFHNNSWMKPPSSVVDAGLEAIVRYFEDLERSGSWQSWMLKVVLVGAVGAGKSSVVESLLSGQPRLVPWAKRTRGVDVHVEEPFKPDKSKPVELVFWDFAGHNDYHATHTLFLSEALVLLVVDLARFVNEPSSWSDSIYIWLDTLLCRIPGAVVQIVATHIDELHDRDCEKACEQLLQVVGDHLKSKRLEHERGWRMHGMKGGDNLAAPNLKVVREIRAVSCKTGRDWLTFGETMAYLAAKGTTYHLVDTVSNAGETGKCTESRLFPSVGHEIPVIWARAGAVLNALRGGFDPGLAATLPLQAKSSDATEEVKCLRWEEALWKWEQIVAASEFTYELGPGGALAVLKDMVNLKVREGLFLLEDGLLHLDPTWMNDLLRAILDHRLQEPEASFWEEKLESFTSEHPEMEFDQLSNAHQTFWATGTLTISYLKFLWRNVKGVEELGVFDRLLQVLRKHGVLFSGWSPSLSDEGTVSVGRSGPLFVPVRLQRYTDEHSLEHFSKPCLLNRWRRQLVYRVWQSYIPPGVIGMLMSRLLVIEGVQFHCAWRQGLSFMMGGSEVMLYLNNPETREGKAEIEVNVVGPKRSDEVESKVLKLQDEVKRTLLDNFPGLRFDLKGGKPHSLEGEDALMDRIDTLEEHMDIRLESIEGALAKVAKSSRESLMCLKNLQTSTYPYPHLFVVRECKRRSAKMGRGGKGRMLSKTLFRSFVTRARTVGKKDMRLQFLCPLDFSEVPCGPDGQGYQFVQTRSWVKKIFPAVQVTAVIAKIALKAVSGLELEVSDFLNALKEGIGEEVADRALDEEALRRVVSGEEVADNEMKRACTEPYEALKSFMDEEEKSRKKHARPGDGYVDFREKMERVHDGKGEMVWVSRVNARQWLESQRTATSA